jgi:hypothetical protein
MGEREKLEDFILNGYVDFLTDAGVNNILLLTVTLKDDVPDIYEGIRKICIKLIFVNTLSRKEYVKHPSQPLAIETIKHECEMQNKIYIKSMMAYKKPICPKILSLEFALGNDRRLLFILLSRINFKRGIGPVKRTKNKLLQEYLEDFIKSKSIYPLAFVVMEYIDSNFKTCNTWTSTDMTAEFNSLNIKFDMEKTKYYLYNIIYKLHKLGYHHCDLHDSNLLLANPIIINKESNESLSLCHYYESSSPLLRDRIRRNLNVDEHITFFEKNPYPLIIDFGRTLPGKPYDNEKSILDNLKCGNEFETIITLNHDTENSEINRKVQELYDEEEIDDTNLPSVIAYDIPHNELIVQIDDIDSYDNVDMQLCKQVDKREKDLLKLLEDINEEIDQAGSSIVESDTTEGENLTQQLSQRLKNMISTKKDHKASVDESPFDEVSSRGLFGSTADYGGGNHNFKNIYTKFNLKWKNKIKNTKKNKKTIKRKKSKTNKKRKYKKTIKNTKKN